PRLVEPRVPPKLDSLVMQLLEKDPRARPVDAHRVEQDLLALASILNAPIPPDPDKDPASSHPESPPSAFLADRPGEWPARLDVFELMLVRLRDRRGDSQRTLAEMRSLAAVLSEVRATSTREQGGLEAIDARGREGRQRFGFAVDALG